MEKIILSLIVPCYNCITTIDSLVDHIPFDQLEDQVEVILVNDGSKDETWNKLQEIKQRYNNSDLIRIYNKENGNWGSVHNFAKKLDIKGKYVKTLDSDDYLDTYGLIKFVQFLNNLPDDVDLVFSNTNFINSKNEIISQRFFSKLFKKEYFKLYDTKINKTSMLTIHAFCEKTDLYKRIPDLPEKMAYMDSVLIFYLIYYSNDNCAFFRYAPLYQYQCGNSTQSISQESFAKHSDWVQFMYKTEVEFAQSEQVFNKVNKKKAHIMGELLQLGWFQMAYSVTYKNEYTTKEKQKFLYDKIMWTKHTLTVGYKWFNSSEIRILTLLKCHIFIKFLKVAVVLVNTGFVKATKKNNKRFAHSKLKKVDTRSGQNNN